MSPDCASTDLDGQQNSAMNFDFHCSIGTTSVKYSCQEVFAQEVVSHFFAFMKAAGFSTGVVCSAMQSVVEEFEAIS